MRRAALSDLSSARAGAARFGVRGVREEGVGPEATAQRLVPRWLCQAKIIKNETYQNSCVGVHGRRFRGGLARRPARTRKGCDEQEDVLLAPVRLRRTNAGLRRHFASERVTLEYLSQLVPKYALGGLSPVRSRVTPSGARPTVRRTRTS